MHTDVTRLLAVSLLLVSCVPKLDVDTKAKVRCSADKECPQGWSCAIELGSCLAPGAEAPRQHESFSLPKDGEENVSTTPKLLVAFEFPLDTASVEGKVRLRDPEGKEVALKPPSFPQERAVLIEPTDELLPLTVYTLTLDAGIGATPEHTALPSGASSTHPFKTAERPDREPPPPVSAIVVDQVSPTRADLSWKVPAVEDFAGVLILRKAGPLDAADVPKRGVSYAVGKKFGKDGDSVRAEVAGVVNGDHVSSVDLSSGLSYDWAFFAFDRAGNYSEARRAPFVTATSLLWCPSETGTFSVTSADKGLQALLLTPKGGGTPIAIGVSSLRGTTAFAAPDVTPGNAYVLRFTASGDQGEYRSPPQPFVASRAALDPLVQPTGAVAAKIGLRGAAVFGFNAYDWPAFDGEVDTDPAPLPTAPVWQSIPVNGRTDVTAVMAIAGSFQLRVRAVVAACPAKGPWVVSDEFLVGGGARYVSFAKGSDTANNGASRVAPYATIERAMADADGAATMDIYVAEGTYAPVAPPRPAGANSTRFGGPASSVKGLVVKANVRLFGGYSTDFLQRDPPPLDAKLQLSAPLHETVVTGDLDSEDYEFSGGGYDSENCRTAVTAITGTQGITLDQLTIRPTSPPGVSICGIYLGQRVGFTLSNSRVHSSVIGNNGYAYSVQMRCGAPVTVSGNLLQPRSGSTSQIGLYATCQSRISDTTISKNWIRSATGLKVGAADVSLSLQEQPRFFVDGNRIEGDFTPGAANNGSGTAVICQDHADLRLTNNVLRPGFAAFNSQSSLGFNRESDCQGVASGNVIDGGFNVSQSVGVSLTGPVLVGHSFVLSNNLISGGLGTQVRVAIRVGGLTGDARHNPEVIVAHNDIFVAATGTILTRDSGRLLEIFGPGGRFVNNVFLGVWSVPGLLFLGGQLDGFQNNLIVTDPSLRLYLDNGTPYGDVPSFEAQMCSATNYSRLQNHTTGNVGVALPLTQLFKSPGGADGLVETLEDNEWTLLPAQAATFKVGLDTSKPLCGGGSGTATACTSAGIHDCGSVSKDRAGVTRPVVPAAGAYEL